MWQKIVLIAFGFLLLVILVFVLVQPWLWKLYFGVDFPVAIEGLNWIFTAIIALLSVGAAAYGILVYQSLKQSLTTALRETIAKEANASSARAFGNISYAFYRNWRFHREDEALIDGAINATECSLRIIEQLGAKEYPELSLKTQYQVMSNLCGYVAYKGLQYGTESVDPKFVSLARKMGAECFKAANRFGQEPDWKANYAGFLNVFGTASEKEKAKEIMEEIKQRQEVSDATYAEYLEWFPDAPSSLRRE